MKAVLFVGLLGNKPPVQVNDPIVAAVPVQPAKFRLGVLRQLAVIVEEHSCVAPRCCSAEIASAKLAAAFPLALPVSGTPFEVRAFPITSFKPSKAPKKKTLSFLIGPPTVAPYCFNWVGSLSQRVSTPSTQLPPDGAGLK